MKTTIATLLLAVIALPIMVSAQEVRRAIPVTPPAASPYAEPPQWTFSYNINPYLPPDCIELAMQPGVQAFIANATELKRGRNNPGPGFVQVAFYVRMPDGMLRFVGWGWAYPEQANAAHRPVMATP